MPRGGHRPGSWGEGGHPACRPRPDKDRPGPEDAHARLKLTLRASGFFSNLNLKVAATRERPTAGQTARRVGDLVRHRRFKTPGSQGQEEGSLSYPRLKFYPFC